MSFYVTGQRLKNIYFKIPDQPTLQVKLLSA